MKKQKPKPEQKPKKKKSGFKTFSRTLTFLILLGCAGYVFYMGWIQFSIPENHYALVFTKTGGYDPYLMEAGQFYWRWENIFPTNMTLHLFELPWKENVFKLNGTLPSGREYSTILQNDSAFSFHIDIAIQYKLNPAVLIPLIQEEGFQFSDIDNWYTTFPHRAETVISQNIQALLGKTELNLNELENRLLSLIRTDFPSVEIESLNIRTWEIPDFVLYNKTREIYIQSIQSNREYASELEKQNAELEKQLTSKIELLKDYGQVLTDYPVLLEYFNLDKEKIDPMIFNWEDLPTPVPES